MANPKDTIRTFIAIDLSEPVQRQLARVQDRLRRESVTRIVRWVKTENIHLTLQFLGDTPAGDVQAIEETLRKTCAAHRPFELEFGALGCFPNVHSPRVVWIGVEEPTGEIARLQRAITSAMSEFGFQPDRKRFAPHLTLGRVKRHVSTRERRALGSTFNDIIGPTPTPQTSAMRVEVVSFIRSQLRPSGSVYTTLAVAPLGAERIDRA